MSKARLLDTFCGAGGCSVGYSRAGFAPYGIDNDPKPLRHYPFPHLCMDALTALDTLLRGEGLTFSSGETLYLADFAAIHASPPCQGYSMMNNLPWHKDKQYSLLIPATLCRLHQTERPFVIENVIGARRGSRILSKKGIADHGLEAGYLCGAMFGLPFYRHRLFYTNFAWLAPGHPKHTLITYSRRKDRAVYGGSLRGLPSVFGADTGMRHPGDEHGIGHARGWRQAAEAMGIDWMDRDGLSQAVPPVMTAYIGRFLLQALLSQPEREEG